MKEDYEHYLTRSGNFAGRGTVVALENRHKYDLISSAPEPFQR
ncbi:hypothetical protein [Natrinema pellirubrum]|nr:hypothetical protein [Natrinema pellirubrum]